MQLSPDSGEIGDRLNDAIFGAGIPQCNLFLAFLTKTYLDSEWCVKELRQVLDTARVKIVPLVDSKETLNTIPREIRENLTFALGASHSSATALMMLVMFGYASVAVDQGSPAGIRALSRKHSWQ